jgi:aspartate/glutamate racemase
LLRVFFLCYGKDVLNFSNRRFLLIGIILLDTHFPRLEGDVGNPQSYSFPVLFEKVKGAIPSRVIRERDVSLIAPFIQAARVLERRGAKAITTSCGFLALWQREMAASVKVPVFSSSLIQVPWAYQIVGRKGKIGVFTADETSLTMAHFEGVGAADIPIVIHGMKPGSEFYKVYIENSKKIDVPKIEKEVVQEVLLLMKGNPNISALVLECANMPVFIKSIREVTKVPIFDILTLVQFISSSIAR